MRERGYYSERTSQASDGSRLDLPRLKALCVGLSSSFDSRGYFQEALGYECVDAGTVPGTLGLDVEAVVHLALHKDGLWPPEKAIDNYTEHDLFDVIEFLHDHISRPIDGYHHTFSNCGMHYSTFNGEDGRKEWRRAVNVLLRNYRCGYELSDKGEILELPEPGLAALTDADVPAYDSENVEIRVERAVARFRRHHSSLEDRRHALRDLADVLEFLRPTAKRVIASKDESDLFNLANNFGIRHHNKKQKTRYAEAIWYSWMFYYYLATIHACVRLIKSSEAK